MKKEQMIDFLFFDVVIHFIVQSEGVRGDFVLINHPPMTQNFFLFLQQPHLSSRPATAQRSPFGVIRRKKITP